VGQLLVCDAGAVSDPSSTITAVPAGQGSTFTVRGTSVSTTQQLVGLSRGGATKGIVRVRSPYLSDNVQGIRFAAAAAQQDDLLSAVGPQQLIAQDTLTVEVTGGGSEYDGALLSTYYDNLAGASPILKMPGDISGQADFNTTWEINAAAPATEGNWANTIITNLYDVSKANSYYAVLGYIVDTPVLGVALNGADTSNFNIGGPGVTEPKFTKAYFADFSMRLGKPCIPVFNTANKGNTNIAVVDVAASTTVNVTLVVAIMPKNWTP
jgi:hypothetical protein